MIEQLSQTVNGLVWSDQCRVLNQGLEIAQVEYSIKCQKFVLQSNKNGYMVNVKSTWQSTQYFVHYIGYRALTHFHIQESANIEYSIDHVMQL